MNYRHAFHAGSAADVLKHAVLALILQSLKTKDAPFCVVDTHAGLGAYDLATGPATRTGEFQGGIAALWGREAPHPALQPYLDAVRSLNPDGVLRYYPGSPRLARTLMRPQDRLVLTELHPEDHAALAGAFARDRRTSVRLGDGYASLKALLPPPERRGVVLIDPPFETADEFARLSAAVRTAHARWPTGIYALWYPIKERPAVWRFHEDIEAGGLRRVLAVELTLHAEDTHLRLNGSGLLLVNPPWRLDDTLAEALPVLHGALPNTGGAARVHWLVPE